MSKYDGVHSCGPNCTQPLCVANRRIAELTNHQKLHNAQLADLANMVESLQAKVDKYKKRYHQVRHENIELQAKVKKLTDRIKWLEINWCNPSGEGE